MNRRTSSRSGLTLIELLLVAGLLGFVLVKGTMVATSVNRVMSDESKKISIEDHGRQILHQIALAIMSSDRRALTPILSPGHSDEINYQVSLGLENGAVVWGPPESYSLEGDRAEQVVWRRDPGQASEKKVVMTNRIHPVEGETINGMDDNGNGLVDEEGLIFVVDDNAVTIRLTLGFLDEAGERSTMVMEKTVTCRNHPLAIP